MADVDSLASDVQQLRSEMQELKNQVERLQERSENDARDAEGVRDWVKKTDDVFNRLRDVLQNYGGYRGR